MIKSDTMKRRRFFQAIAAAPAVPAALAQQPSPAGRNAAPSAPAQGEPPPLTPSVPDAAAETVTRFFTAPQLAALRRLGDVIMPPMAGAPGASQTGAAEFLDFLLGQSSADRQQLYRAGLDNLNAQAKKRAGKSFADLDAPQADAILAPLNEPFSPEPPSDPFTRFLLAARQDLRTATLNSREYAAAGQSSGGRRFGGSGLYWYPLD